MNLQKQDRRKKALAMLEDQLKSGVKTLSKRTASRQDGNRGDVVPLNKHDIERIKHQIDTLRERLI